jgi:Asp-tRNA(Asn)/Glu-tRNA(Gln) amidotransferase A subunit family amidase
MARANELSVREALAAMDGGSLTATALLEACLERIGEREAVVGAWTHLAPEAARARARAIDADRGAAGALAGIPFGAKDIIDTADMPTAYGTPIHAGHRPAADAAPVALARAAGAVLLGKTVTTELANLTPGKTANPLDPARTPGGSSSGSAAAVADHMVPFAYGTQTTQSVIRPAAYCGVYGYCPTYGDFRLSGVKEAAGSFDRLGLITRSLEDIGLLRAVLLREPAGATRSIAETPPVIGLCRTSIDAALEPAMRQAVEDAASRLARAGAEVREIAFPADFARLPEAHRAVSSFEFARNFTHEITHHWEQLSEQLRRGRIADGLACSFESYRAARAFLADCRSRLPALVEGVDVLVTAATPGEAPLGLQATGPALVGGLFTPLLLPCLTLPVFRGPAGLPMGLQVLSLPDTDERLLEAAGWIESRLGREH